MKKAERFIKLQKELKDYIKPLGEAVDIMLNNEVTKYPIFVVHQQEVAMGIPLMNKDEIAGNWSVNASSLEEMVTKQIVHNDKIQDFIKDFKDPADHICVFALSELGAQFIYLVRT